MQLTLNKHLELVKKGYNLDIVFILQQIEEGAEIEDGGSAKYAAIIQSVKRKGLISDTGQLTLEGKQILAFLSTEEDTKLVKKRPIEDHFNEWWKVFPGVDTFEYKGRKFVGSRALRAKKEDCRIKFNKVIAEGEYSVQELIEALKLEIEQKKEKSVKEGKNILSYMQNSLTYLTQRTFEPYCELVKNGNKAKEEEVNYKPTNETFI